MAVRYDLRAVRLSCFGLWLMALVGQVGQVSAQRAITVFALQQEKSYGDVLTLDSTQFAVFDADGDSVLPNGNQIDSVSLISATGIDASATADVAAYSDEIIIVGVSGSGGFLASNYDITFVAGDLVVNRRPVTLTATAQAKDYGDVLTPANSAFSVTDRDGGGLPNGELINTVSLVSAGGVAASTDADVGNYSDNLSFVPTIMGGGGFNAENYIFSYVSGDLTVNRRAVTVSASTQERSYGDSLSLDDTAFEVLDRDGGSTLPNGEVMTNVTLSSATGVNFSTAADAASYSSEIVISGPVTGTSGTGDGFLESNYDITFEDGDLRVNPRPIEISLERSSKIVGEQVFFSSLIYILTDSDGDSFLPNGEALSNVIIASQTGVFEDRFAAIGNYENVVSLDSIFGGGGFDEANYAIEFVSQDFLVRPLPSAIVSNLEGSELAANGRALLYEPGRTVAQAFETGLEERVLGSVTVTLSNTDSSESSVAGVQVWSGSGSVPEVLVEDLGSIEFEMEGDFDYTISSRSQTRLSAFTRYWVIVTNQLGDFEWRSSVNALESGSATFGSSSRRAVMASAGGIWSILNPGSSFRQVMAVGTWAPTLVTNTNPSGPGSLREAVGDAPEGSTINFWPTLAGETIQWDGSEVVVDNDLEIDGSNLSEGIVLDGNRRSRHFRLDGGATLSLRYLTLMNGRSEGNGGSVLVGSGERVNLVHSTLHRNHSEMSGGAIAVGGGDVFAFNSTLTGNFCGGMGGAFFGDGSVVELNSVTITENSSGNVGGGLATTNDSFLFMRNSIVAGNRGPAVLSDVAQFSPNAASNIAGQNLLSTTEFSQLGHLSQVSVGMPELARLGDYGGLVSTMPPLPSQSNFLVIDMGTQVTGLTDQRGQARIVGHAPDIGAVEYQGLPLETELAFEEDADGDGSSVGVEFATGTNPWLADPNAAGSFQSAGLLPGGSPSFSFGYVDSSIELKLVRSTDLIDFSHVVAISGANFLVSGQPLQVNDSQPPAGGKAFYRLEAVRP